MSLLVETNKLKISSALKFIILAHLNRIDEALNVLEHEEIDFIEQEDVREAFFKMLELPQITEDTFKKPPLREVAKQIVNADVELRPRKLTKKVQFEKIAFLRDWRGVKYFTKSDNLLWAMVDKGAAIPFRSFCDLDYTNELLDEMWRRDPHTYIYRVLRKASTKICFSVMDRYGLTPLSELNGIAAVFLLLPRTFGECEKILKENINHMDSSGNTALSIGIKYLHVLDVDKILVLGADPNHFNPDKISPLALAVISSKSNHYLQKHILIINMLQYRGADINGTCTFEGRICTPLMIAVRIRCKLCLITLLIALGSRVDYCDETGKSIVECLVQNKSRYKDGDYKDIMRLLSKK
jgi:hypothetical protein